MVNTAIPQPLCSYSPPDDLLDARVVMVTGASDGIGRAVSLACARCGATVIALDKKARRLEILYDEVVAAGYPEPVLAVQDLEKLDWEKAQGIAAGVAHDFGRLDALLHNAGELRSLSPLHAYDLGQWDLIMQVNLRAPYLLTRATLPLLRAADHASLIFTSADVGRRGRAYWGAYGVAYAGVEGLARIWAEELENNTAIRVNTLDPGPVRTRLRGLAYPGEDPQSIPDAGVVVPAYLYLLGDESKEVRGRALNAQA